MALASACGSIHRDELRLIFPPHRLQLAIGYRAPEPFHRSEPETAHPPHTDGHLKSENNYGYDEHALIAHVAVPAKSLIVEERNRDKRLRQVRGERHAANRGQGLQWPSAGGNRSEQR